MKKKHITLIVLGLILLVAILTNPNQDRHKEVISAKINAYVQKSMLKELDESENNSGQLDQTLGIMFSNVLVKGIISSVMTTDNYIFFSTTKINWDGESRIIGFGIFGNVFLTKQIDEALEEGLLSE